MLFNSTNFLIFLPVIFVLYWIIANKSIKSQNLLLLIASYVFYGWWDWRMLFLLLALSLINYFIGLSIDKSRNESQRKIWLYAGLIVNIGTLCVFKYYNFFIDSFIQMISHFGYDLPRSSTRIVLPVGISFYTFLSLSYIIDIFKKNLSASKSVPDVLLSLSFFPIVLAGPIQRPASLLPQITGRRQFEYSGISDGLRQILWGLFKKVVLADTCAGNADYIFSNHSTLDGSVLVMGVIYFAFQIYGDFSGYSDMAIGLGRLFGFNLMRNFAYPYFSRDIGMFWQRWHISLTTWFRDYVFLPLSFSISWKLTKEKVLFIKSDLFIYIVASIITWFLTGLWHGAYFTFIVWGLIHGFFLILYQWQKAPRKKWLKKSGISNDHPVIVVLESLITITIILFSWIFFKSPTIQDAFKYIHDVFANGIFNISILDLRGRGITSTLIDATVAIIAVIFIEWTQRNKQHGLEISRFPLMVRWSLYWIITFVCLLYLGDERTFIYFQF